MKIFLIFLGLILCGCSHQGIYNAQNVGPQMEIVDAKTKPQIVVFLNKSENQNFKPSSTLGKDEELSINLDEFASNSTQKFLRHFYKDVTISDNLEVIKTSQIVVYPTIQNFKFGFFDRDNFGISSFPFVQYDFKLKITEKGKEIFNDFISDDDKKQNKEEIFYGNAKSSFAAISPLLQYHLENDLLKNKDKIFQTIK